MAQSLDERLVPFGAVSPQIIEQSPPLTHQFEQPTARVVVFFVHLEVFREAVDSLGDERNLDLGRARVRLVDAVGLDSFGLGGF